jgi:hypothetical protein
MRHRESNDLMRALLALAGLLVIGCSNPPTCAGLSCNCANATTCDFSAQTTCVNTTNNCMLLCGTGSICNSGQCGEVCHVNCAAGSQCNFSASDGSTLECNHATCTLHGGGSSKAVCTGNATCTITLGETGTVSCDTSTSCGVSVGAGSTVTCGSAASCDITCAGVCSVDCTGASCTLHCGGAAAQTVDNATASCPSVSG